jgi:hypothetical protein
MKECFEVGSGVVVVGGRAAGSGVALGASLRLD